MKNGIFAAFIILNCIFTEIGKAQDHPHAQANAHEAIHSEISTSVSAAVPVSAPDSSAARGKTGNIVAVETQSQTGISTGMILTTGSQEKRFVDNQNMKIVLAPQSVAEFSGQGVFRLMRGSAYLDSNKVERRVNSTNAGINFNGRVLMTFDHREHSTSCFVIVGEAKMLNLYEAERTIPVSKNQGASLVTGEIYPTLVRGLNLADAEDWLKGYNWSTVRRKEFLRELTQTVEMTKMAENAKEKPSADEEDVYQPGAKPNPLADYYTTIYEQQNIPNKHEEYKEVLETKKEEVVKKDPDFVMSPEQAAVVPLPDTKISTEFSNILSEEEYRTEEKMPPAPTNDVVVERKIASVAKPRVAKSAPKVLSPEEKVLAHLRSISGQEEMESRPVGRGPASIEAPTTKKVKSGSLVPDPVYDLSENF